MSPLPLPTDISIILTYRCPMACAMCNVWKNPTSAEKEITPAELETLPHFKFVNITGGEPFVREDLEEVVAVLRKRSDRIVVSTSGWHQELILKMARRFPDVGYRISLEGMESINDQLRGREGGFQRGLNTLLELKHMGILDIGFGITISDNNSTDMLQLYELSRELKMEFATAVVHNSYYFHKFDNRIKQPEVVSRNLEELIHRLLKEKNPKSWFRAFFNFGLIQYVRGNKRLLPCEAGTVNCFLDPYGELYPCNGMEPEIWMESMGNIRTSGPFEEIWESRQAAHVRTCVATCPKNCWMVGTAAPVMKKYLRHPLGWVIQQKLKVLLGREMDLHSVPKYDVGQDPRQGRGIEE